MKKYFAILMVVAGVGMTVVAGCRHPSAFRGFGASNHVAPAYATETPAPAYSPNYQPPYDQGGSSGSGTRRAPVFQGSGSR